MKIRPILLLVTLVALVVFFWHLRRLPTQPEDENFPWSLLLIY
jgi:hypothetical protein